MSNELHNADSGLPTPAERRRLRDALYDLWRDQLQCVRELSVLLSSADADRASDEDLSPNPMRAALEELGLRLAEVRRRLVEIEHAMRRLDDRSYGRCVSCGAPIPFGSLITTPGALTCVACSLLQPGTDTRECLRRR